MPKKEDYNAISADEIGLDRSRINHHHQIELPLHDDSFAPKQVTLEPERKRDKIKKVLHLKQDSASDLPDNNRESPLFAKPGDEPSKGGLKVVAKKVVKEINKDNIKGFVEHPVKTVNDGIMNRGSHEAAANMAAKEIPYEQDKEILRAHDAVLEAGSDAEKERTTDNLEHLFKERQTNYVRWTLDRHVTNVRVLPRDLVAKEPLSKFQTKDPNGRVKTDWRGYVDHLFMYYVQQYGGQYIGAGTGIPSPSKQDAIPSVERLLVASAPFQQIVMTIRRIYRWENPSETAKYLVIYTILWWFNVILPGMLSATMYFVIARYVQGNTLEDLRKDIKRTEDACVTALSITEFIEKRGDEHWADDIVQALGPWLMLQIADMANAFEALRNFYEWRVPHRTAIALSIMILGILVLVFTPLWLLVKVAGFDFGICFFALWPIASNYPQFRLLTSISKRVFWNIPTNAEWAIQSMQAEGSRQFLEDARKPNSALSNGSTKQTVYGTYNVHFNSKAGRLVVGALSVRLEYLHENALPIFDLKHSQINNVEKKNRYIPQIKPDSGKDLKIISRAKQEWLLENMDGRNMAFSQIVGLSDWTWQVLW